MDDIANEMIRYGGEKLYAEIVKLMKNIFISSQIPVEWKSSNFVQILQRVHRMD